MQAECVCACACFTNDDGNRKQKARDVHLGPVEHSIIPIIGLSIGKREALERIEDNTL